eukprot:TRINITY_DN3265_c0_g1_i1.p1 TRINITY_DN3265_c0_g1~~TRINITY_DN3265_c0_g1_i1.p1  ORF type:complete len:284 (+),score=47.74 TRINITY_DN3265_c0_g1_i1:37-888(+)
MNTTVLLTLLFAVIVQMQASGKQVLTPGGYRDENCVHQVPHGTYIYNDRSDDGVPVLFARYPNGTNIKYNSPCLMGTSIGVPYGWTAFTHWQSQKPITTYNGQWGVSNLPPSQDGQTLFLFTGLQNSFGEENLQQMATIIQPVLQYGPSAAGGGPFWAIASWLVTSSGHSVYSILEKVQPGGIIIGNMTKNQQGNWEITAYSTTNKKKSGIVVDTGSNEPYAFVTLEVYGVEKCNDFPTGSTVFNDLYIVSDKEEVPQWQKESQDQCEEAINIQSPKIVSVKW